MGAGRLAGGTGVASEVMLPPITEKNLGTGRSRLGGDRPEDRLGGWTAEISAGIQTKVTMIHAGGEAGQAEREPIDRWLGYG